MAGGLSWAWCGQTCGYRCRIAGRISCRAHCRFKADERRTSWNSCGTSRRGRSWRSRWSYSWTSVGRRRGWTARNRWRHCWTSRQGRNVHRRGTQIASLVVIRNTARLRGANINCIRRRQLVLPIMDINAQSQDAHTGANHTLIQDITIHRGGGLDTGTITIRHRNEGYVRLRTSWDQVSHSHDN